MIIKHVLKIHIAMHRFTCFSELYLGHHREACHAWTSTFVLLGLSF
jgi:hypothetical protein